MSAWSARDGAWKKARERVLRSSTHCAICGRALNFAAKPRSRWSPSVDHILPLSRLAGMSEPDRMRMALDPLNLRAVHYGCNSRRGDRTGPTHVVRRKSSVW